MDPADYNTSPVVKHFQATVSADSPVTGVAIKLLFQELINQKAARDANKMRQKKLVHRQL